MECKTDAAAKIMVANHMGCDPECTPGCCDPWIYSEYTDDRDFCSGDGGFLHCGAFDLAPVLAIVPEKKVLN